VRLKGAGDSLTYFFTSVPGSYVFRVRRVGIQGTGVTTLIKDFEFVVLEDPEHPVPSGPFNPPNIWVTFSGTISNGKFHVIGNGFIPNSPGPFSSQAIIIRVVDANIPMVDFTIDSPEKGDFTGLPLDLLGVGRELTSSDNWGSIDHTFEGDLEGLTLNALGVGTVAISATDGRQKWREGFGGLLWSNTVKYDFSA
jgi:hypothetical protein